MKNKKLVRICSMVLMLLLVCSMACPASAANGNGDFWITPPNIPENGIEYTSDFSLQTPAEIVTNIATKSHTIGLSTSFNTSSLNVTYTVIPTLLPEGAPNYDNFNRLIENHNLVRNETPECTNLVTVDAYSPSGIYGIKAYYPGRCIHLAEYTYDENYICTKTWGYDIAFVPIAGQSYYDHYLVE